MQSKCTRIKGCISFEAEAWELFRSGNGSRGGWGPRRLAIRGHRSGQEVRVERVQCVGHHLAGALRQRVDNARRRAGHQREGRHHRLGRQHGAGRHLRALFDDALAADHCAAADVHKAADAAGLNKFVLFDVHKVPDAHWKEGYSCIHRIRYPDKWTQPNGPDHLDPTNWTQPIGPNQLDPNQSKQLLCDYKQMSTSLCQNFNY